MHVFSRLLQRSLKIIRFDLLCFAKVKFNVFKPTNKIKLFGLGIFGVNLGFILLSNCFVNANCLSSNNSGVLLNNSEVKKKEISYLNIWQPTNIELFIFLLAVLSAIVAALVNIEIPLKLGKVVNVLSNLKSEKSSNFFELLKIPSLELMAYYIIQTLSTTSYISFLSIIGERMAVRLKNRMFERIIMQDAEFFDFNRSGDLLNRVISDVQDFKSSFKQCISQGLRSFITIIGSTIALVFVSKELTSIVIVAVPTCVLLGTVFGRLLRSLSHMAQLQNSKSTEVANEGIANIRTVKSFAMEDIEIELFSAEVHQTGKLYSFLGIGIGIFQGLSNLVINGLVLGVLFVGGYMMNNGNLTPGDLISFLVASQTIQKSMTTLSTLFGHLVKANASGARIIEFLALGNCATSPHLTELEIRRKLKYDYPIIERHPVSVEFRNISFSYPTRAEQIILQNFSLHIPKGSVVALCGESGSGKSTIGSLLQRLYDPLSGDILINGVNIKDMSVSELRTHQIGSVSQQPQLFAKSIRENIRYGNIHATDSEVEEAAKQAQAHEFILGFENGYDTLVGERGGEALSGGQRQRIAIARAILKNPNILLLDEATSALDSKSEILVQNALSNVMKGRTVIIIAHRLSTIKNADKIVVLQNGNIVEVGSHDVLMKKNGYYNEFVKKLEDSDN